MPKNKSRTTTATKDGDPPRVSRTDIMNAVGQIGVLLGNMNVEMNRRFTALETRLATIESQLSQSSGFDDVEPVTLTPSIKQEEVKEYKRLFALADADKDGVIGTTDVYFLMSQCQVSRKQCAEIWTLVTSGDESKSSLSEDEFNLALRLASLAQQGLPLSVEKACSPDVPPPHTKEQREAEAKAKLLSDLKSFFAKAAQPEDGKIRGDVLRKLLDSTKLPQGELDQIWSLVDVEEHSALSMEQFLTLCRIVHLKIPGWCPNIDDIPGTSTSSPAPSTSTTSEPSQLDLLTASIGSSSQEIPVAMAQSPSLSPVVSHATTTTPVVPSSSSSTGHSTLTPTHSHSDPFGDVEPSETNVGMPSGSSTQTDIFSPFDASVGSKSPALAPSMVSPPQAGGGGDPFATLDPFASPSRKAMGGLSEEAPNFFSTT